MGCHIGSWGACWVWAWSHLPHSKNAPRKSQKWAREEEIMTNFDAIELEGRYEMAAWHWLTLPRRRRGRQSGHQTTDSPYLPTVTLIGYRRSAVQPIYTKTFPGYLRLSRCVCVCASSRRLLHALPPPPRPFSVLAVNSFTRREKEREREAEREREKTFPPRWHSSS